MLCFVVLDSFLLALGLAILKYRLYEIDPFPWGTGAHDRIEYESPLAARLSARDAERAQSCDCQAEHGRPKYIYAIVRLCYWYGLAGRGHG
jgi:hypothetical protein